MSPVFSSQLVKARCDVPLVRVFRSESPLLGGCPSLLGRHAISKHAAGSLDGSGKSPHGASILDRIQNVVYH